MKNQPVMLPAGAEILRGVAAVLRKYPFVHVLVDGHAKVIRTHWHRSIACDRAHGAYCGLAAGAPGRGEHALPPAAVGAEGGGGAGGAGD
jgi:hypothetical protein